MNLKLFFCLIVIIIIFFPKLNDAESLFNNDSTVQYKRLNINNISTIFSNNGLSDFDKPNESGGFKYPRESNITGFWFSGFLWGGKINGEVRVGGTTYKTSLQPSGDKRIYRVRKDYKAGDLSSEVNDGEGSEEEIRTEYEVNWNEWPAEEGAPYEDINGNGIYEAAIDIPGFPGADQTIWFKSDDFDTTLVNEIFGSLPIGIELEATYWGYNENSPLGNTIFRKYKLTNKSNNIIEGMYASISTDPDVGDASDDFVGCDSVLNLAFTYNSVDNDNIFNETPPSVGYKLLEGPKINNDELGLSSFNFIINADPVYGHPGTGSYDVSLAFYNLFQGIPSTNDLYEIPQRLGGGYTPFPFSGNPATSEGWVEGVEFPPGNRNMGLSTGPFDLAPNESQEIVFAQITAGGISNISRLEAIDTLKNYANYVQEFYNKVGDSTTIISKKNNLLPAYIELYQNYPNPFNPSTTINYSLPVHSNVSLKVYDLLGREIETLVDKEQMSGKHIAHFDGKDLPSGVYIYTLKADQYSYSKKLVLIK